MVGPKDYTTTINKLKPKPSGQWRFVQHASDGKEYGFQGVYHSVIPPEQIISTFEFEGAPGHVSLETLSLKEQHEKTKLTNTSVFQTIEHRDRMLKSGMKEGTAETMDRLARILAKDGQNRTRDTKSPT
jgi:uncharacterized protein YndB with AHSA1/START domain